MGGPVAGPVLLTMLSGGLGVSHSKGMSVDMGWVVAAADMRTRSSNIDSVVLSLPLLGTRTSEDFMSSSLY